MKRKWSIIFSPQGKTFIGIILSIRFCPGVNKEMKDYGNRDKRPSDYCGPVVRADMGLWPVTTLKAENTLRTTLASFEAFHALFVR